MKHSIKRLQAFSDAVLAIAATVLAVPLAKIDETTKLDMYLRGKSLRSILVSDYQLESFAIFVGSFILVYLVWVRHGRQFTRLSREEVAGDTPALVVTNMIELFLATLLPYTAASAARARLTINYEDDDSDRRNLAMPFCANVFALATTRVVFESLALRARPSIEAGLFNLCEAVTEMATSMLVLALASSVLAGEEIFLPFLAVPAASALVRLILIYRYGEQDHRRMDWHRLEGFVDGCVAVVSTLMVLEIRPPPDCSDMKFETCVLHFADGCRLKFEMEKLFKPKCYLERTAEQQRDIVLICVYFVCFCCMVLLWYAHHEVVHFAYLPPSHKRRSTTSTPSGMAHTNNSDNLLAPPPPSNTTTAAPNQHPRSDGGLQAFALSGWFCAAVGLFPFAFGLVAEFAVDPYDQFHDPRIFPEFEAPLDPNASKTACLFAVGTILSASVPIVLLLILGPRRRSVPWAVLIRVMAFGMVSLLNLGLLMAWEQVRLWPMFLVVPLLAFSGVIGRVLDRYCCRCRPAESNGDDALLGSFDASGHYDPSFHYHPVPTGRGRTPQPDGSTTPPTVAAYRPAPPPPLSSTQSGDFIILSGTDVTPARNIPPAPAASSSSGSGSRNRRMSASQEYFSNFT